MPGALVVLADRDADMTVNELRELLRPHLAAYKLPQKLSVSKEPLQRNAMGKIQKKALAPTIKW